MINKKPGYLLVILLIVIAIIALIVFSSGYFSSMFGSKSTTGTVNYQIDDMEQKVFEHLQEQQDVLQE